MWRRILASVLVVLGVILLLLSGYGWWAKRYFLDSERFTAKANNILDEPDVQDALAFAITDQISQQSGRDLQLAEPVIQSIVGQIVGSDAFQTIFDAAVFRAHHAVVEGGAREMVLNLSESVDSVRSAIKPIAPNLAKKIPKGEKVELRIFDKTQLDTIYNVTDIVKKGVIAITVAAVLFLAGGIALSPRRWRTLALAGWVTLGVFAVSLIAVSVGRPITGSLIAEDTYSDAVQASYKVITRGLIVQGVVFSLLGLLVALLAGWIDRHGGWAAATGAVKQGGSWAKSQMPKKAATPEPALVAAGSAAAVAVDVDAGRRGVVATAESSPQLPGDTVAATSDAVKTGAVAGVLATRLPAPARRPRTAHWWRAVALLVVGLFAVFSPGSLTNIVVVLLGLVLLYLAVTEGFAAWASPKEPKPAADDAGDAASNPSTESTPEDEPPDAA